MTQVNEQTEVWLYQLNWPIDRRGLTYVKEDVCQAAARDNEMNEGLVWQKIATAPYDRDLELAVIEEDRVYPLVFACRRVAGGWLKVPSMDRLLVNPTHWRAWPTKH